MFSGMIEIMYNTTQNSLFPFYIDIDIYLKIMNLFISYKLIY